MGREGIRGYEYTVEEHQLAILAFFRCIGHSLGSSRQPS